VIQVCYQDTSELILASGSGSVTFITARKEFKTTPLYSDLEKQDPSLFKRLNYAKEILLNMIHPENEESRGNKENPTGEKKGIDTQRPSTAKCPVFSLESTSKHLEPEIVAAIKGNALKYHNSQHKKSEILDEVDDRDFEY
jgi:hypothetical protein